MFGNTLKNKLKQFDVYRKLPSDLTEPTFSGALVSIISTIIMVILFISEFSEYMEVQTISEMYVDVAKGDSKLHINIDISFFRFPCDILSLDTQDIMGEHQVNQGGDLKKFRLDSHGNVIEMMAENLEDHAGHHHDQSNQVNLERTIKAFNDQEGCQLKGVILINRVPGNFHISAHAFGAILPQIFSSTKIQFLDLQHKVNHISFGQESKLKDIRKKFSQGVLNPLDGVQKVPADQNQAANTLYQYYLNIVPTSYIDIRGNEYNVYQFTSSSNEVGFDRLPQVTFRYEISPITVKFTQQSEGFFHFLVQICAIIGGVYTVAGIIDSLLHRSIHAILKKASIGKLN